MQEQEIEIDLMEYIRVLWRWLWLILFAAVITGGVALGISFLLPPVYEAEAAVVSVKSFSQISLSPEYKTLSEAQLTGGLDILGRQKALLAIARSSEIASTVIAELGDALLPEERQIVNLIPMVTITTNGDLISIKAQNRDPGKAVKIANTWARAFLTRVNQIYTETPANLAQVQAQAAQALQNYQIAESALVQFIGTNRIEPLSREIAAKQNTINDLYATQRNLDRLWQDAKALQELIAKGSPNDVNDRLATLLVRANAATAASYAPGFQMQMTSSVLTDAASSPRAQVDALVASLEARKKQVDTQIADPTLQSQVLALQKELEQQNAKKQELTAARDLAWSIYKTMASKIEEVRLTQQSSSTIVRLAGSAVVPERPAAPRKANNALIAAGIGVLLALVIAFLVEFRNPRIHTLQDVSKKLGLAAFQVRADTPRVKSPVPENLRPSGDYYQMWLGAFSAVQSNGAVLIAGGTKEDPSAVAANLGLVAAYAGRSVVLVETNGRVPALAQTFGLANERGWSDLLRNGAAGVGNFLQPTHVSNMRVLTSGAMVDGIDALTVSSRLGEVISALKSQANLVVFPVPSAMAAPDFVLIARQVGAAILLAVAGKTSRREIAEIWDALQQVGVNLLGVILVQPAPPPSRWGALVQQISPTWR
jgi:non-specific protein-tyrosine kinase